MKTFSPALWRHDITDQFNPEKVFDFLIPIQSSDDSKKSNGSRGPVIVGHNVAFDRQYIQSEYADAERFLSEGVTSDKKYLDTMAMHQAVCGVTQVNINVIL